MHGATGATTWRTQVNVFHEESVYPSLATGNCVYGSLPVRVIIMLST